MISREVVHTETVFTSEVLSEVSSTHPVDGEVIAWADQNPKIWKIVLSHRSVFGQNSSDYHGYERGPSGPATLARARKLREALEVRTDAGWVPKVADSRGPQWSFWLWRAEFTLAHFGEKHFKAGYLEQHDGQYRRGVVKCDYTPETLEEVVTRFVAWCDDHPCRYETRAILLDGQVVRGQLELLPQASGDKRRRGRR